MKPHRLYAGDTIAIISPAWGCAGESDVKWRYDLGVQRLLELGLHTVPAPNALRGEEFLKSNPQARSDDLMWAFEAKHIKGIVASIGGNDSDRLLPHLNPASILHNPKVFCGYSDITTLHLYCHHLGLSTFYGPNLLTTVAETPHWHAYSRYWFKKALFDPSPLGEINSSPDWSSDPNCIFDPHHCKQYETNPGYFKIQGSGTVQGKLFGGNGETLLHCAMHHSALIQSTDFENSILFIEDIPQTWTQEYVITLFHWLGSKGYLKQLNGIIIGKMCIQNYALPHSDIIRQIVSFEYECPQLPIMYGLNFGHASPICTLPYDAYARMDTEKLQFSILDQGVT